MARAQASPTALMEVRVSGAEGAMPADARAEVMVIPEGANLSPDQTGKWQPVVQGLATITADQITTRLHDWHPVAKYHVIARARDHAPAFATVPVPKGISSTTPLRVDLVVKKGRQATIQLIAAPGKPLPADLTPWLVPDWLLYSTWMGQNPEAPTAPANVCAVSPNADGLYTFNVAEDTPPLYVVVHHKKFLRGWQSPEPVPTTGTVENPAQITLPAPAIANVLFENANVEAGAGASQNPPCVEIQAKLYRADGRAFWPTISRDCNPEGKRTWRLSDLAPTEYMFAAREGLAESNSSERHELVDYSSITLALKSLPVLPPLVALSETGQPLYEFEAVVASDQPTGLQSIKPEQAVDGEIRFQYGKMVGSKSDLPSELPIEVRAPGFALLRTTLPVGGSSGKPVAVVLQRGESAKIRLKSADGRAIPPTLQPIIIDSKNLNQTASASRPELSWGLAVATKTAPDEFEFRLPANEKDFRVALAHPDVLRLYYTEPLTVENTGTLDVEIPAPGTLDLHLIVPPVSGPAASTAEYRMDLVRPLTTRTNSAREIPIHAFQTTESTSTVITNLSPGTYSVSFAPSGQMSGVEARVEVKSGTTATISLAGKPKVPTDEFGREIFNLPLVRVTNEQGQPVSAAEVSVVTKESNSVPQHEWQGVTADGTIQTTTTGSFGKSSSAGTFGVNIRAPGYYPVVRTVDLPTSETEMVVALHAGSPVKLELQPADGHPLPADFVPAVFPESMGVDTWLSLSEDMEFGAESEKTFSAFSLRQEGDGKFTLNVDPQSTEPLYVMVHRPGFLRGYQAGPFLPAEWATSGTVTVTLPKPSSITGTFKYAPEDAPPSEKLTMGITRTTKVPGANRWGLTVVAVDAPLSSPTLTLDDLSSGSYEVQGTPGTEADRMGNKAQTVDADLELGAGETTSVDLLYRPFKKEWLKGPYKALLKITNMQGKPAKGARYEVTWQEQGYPKQTLAEGAVPADGTVTLENLVGAEREMTSADWKDLGRAPSFDLKVDGQRLGYLSFWDYRDKKFFPPKEGKTKEFTFKIPPKVGDLAPDFEMLDLKTSTTMRLSDLKGKVVLVDFWATWCGPCQGPMAENQEVLRRNDAAWKDKAVILAVSIDDESETALEHLDKNKWHETLNTWAPAAAEAPDKTGWESPAAKLYGINSIPTMLLIDRNGTIVERGRVQDIEGEINALLH